MASTDRSASLTIRNETADLALVRDALERFGQAHGVAPRSLTQVQVALDELVSNVVKYAWPDGGTHELSVCFTAQATTLEIEIVDDGKAFDPCSAAAPKRLAPGEKPKPGGVGIHMVRQLVDGMEYARIAGRNHVKLVKKGAFAAQPQKGR